MALIFNELRVQRIDADVVFIGRNEGAMFIG